MGIAERKEREKETQRERILDAALQLAAGGDLESLTMRKIAERIEYSPTAIYAHFADKEELVRALCTREFCQLGAAVGDLGDVKDPLERIGALGRAYARFALEHPEAYMLMFLSRGTPEAPNDQGMGLSTVDGQLVPDAYATCVAIVDEARKAGLLRKELTDSVLVAQVLWSALHGVLALHLVKRDKHIEWRDIHARIDTMIETLLLGLKRH